MFTILEKAAQLPAILKGMGNVFVSIEHCITNTSHLVQLSLSGIGVVWKNMISFLGKEEI